MKPIRSIVDGEFGMKTNLLIRNIDPDLLAALAKRAGQHGRSVEEEHLQILRQALQRPPRPDPQQFIAQARALRAALPSIVFHADDIDDAKRAGQK